MAIFSDYNFAGKKALVRVDFNVPLNEEGKITDDTRIRGAMPTLKKIIADGGSVVIMSHMGKPKGTVNPKLSLGQIVDAAAAAMGTKVTFAPGSTHFAQRKFVFFLFFGLNHVSHNEGCTSV